MFRFVKKCFFVAMTFLSCNVLNVNPLKCVIKSSNKKKDNRY